MSLDNNDRKALIQYRIEQAEELIEEVDFLIDADKLNTAVNRIYYGAFYMLTALALLNEYETSKHKQLIGWFIKNFIHKKIFAKLHGKFVYEAYNCRNKGDYEPFTVFTKEEVNILFRKMDLFVNTVKRYISTQI